jgi:hypothetical protein
MNRTNGRNKVDITNIPHNPDGIGHFIKVFCKALMTCGTVSIILFGRQLHNMLYNELLTLGKVVIKGKRQVLQLTSKQVQSLTNNLMERFNEIVESSSDGYYWCVASVALSVNEADAIENVKKFIDALATNAVAKLQSGIREANRAVQSNDMPNWWIHVTESIIATLINDWISDPTNELVDPISGSKINVQMLPNSQIVNTNQVERAIKQPDGSLQITTHVAQGVQPILTYSPDTTYYISIDENTYAIGVSDNYKQYINDNKITFEQGDIKSSAEKVKLVKHLLFLESKLKERGDEVFANILRKRAIENNNSLLSYTDDRRDNEITLYYAKKFMTDRNEMPHAASQLTKLLAERTACYASNSMGYHCPHRYVSIREACPRETYDIIEGFEKVIKSSISKIVKEMQTHADMTTLRLNESRTDNIALGMVLACICFVMISLICIYTLFKTKTDTFKMLNDMDKLFVQPSSNSSSSSSSSSSRRRQPPRQRGGSRRKNRSGSRRKNRSGSRRKNRSGSRRKNRSGSRRKNRSGSRRKNRIIR